MAKTHTKIKLSYRFFIVKYWFFLKHAWKYQLHRCEYALFNFFNASNKIFFVLLVQGKIREYNIYFSKRR